MSHMRDKDTVHTLANGPSNSRTKPSRANIVRVSPSSHQCDIETLSCLLQSPCGRDLNAEPLRQCTIQDNLEETRCRHRHRDDYITEPPSRLAIPHRTRQCIYSRLQVAHAISMEPVDADGNYIESYLLRSIRLEPLAITGERVHRPLSLQYCFLQRQSQDPPFA